MSLKNLVSSLYYLRNSKAYIHYIKIAEQLLQTEILKKMGDRDKLKVKNDTIKGDFVLVKGFLNGDKTKPYVQIYSEKSYKKMKQYSVSF